MSRLRELIDELCPDGVEYIELGRVSRIDKGKQLNKSLLLDEGLYPVINGGIEPSGWWNEHNANAETVAVSQGGNSAGYVNDMRVPYWAGAHCYVIEADKDYLSSRYMFHVVKAQEDWLMSHKEGAGIPSLSRKTLYSMQIPVPPKEVQAEVAAILDAMQCHLIALERDLAAQRKLTDAILCRLFELRFGSPLRGNAPNQLTLQLKDALVKGASVSYGIVQTGDDYNGGVPVFRPVDIARDHVPNIEELKRTAPEISARFSRTVLDGSEILITVRGVVGELFLCTKEFATCNVGRNIVPLKVDENKYDRFFLYFLLKQPEVQDWLARNTKGVAQVGLNMGEFRTMPIIMPSLIEQKDYLKAIPDYDEHGHFRLISCLESEISLRKLQLEYYREKLLTFHVKEN